MHMPERQSLSLSLSSLVDLAVYWTVLDPFFAEALSDLSWLIAGLIPQFLSLAGIEEKGKPCVNLCGSKPLWIPAPPLLWFGWPCTARSCIITCSRDLTCMFHTRLEIDLPRKTSSTFAHSVVVRPISSCLFGHFLSSSSVVHDAVESRKQNRTVWEVELLRIARFAEVLPCVHCTITQLLLNAHQLVVLRKALRSAGRTRFDLTST